MSIDWSSKVSALLAKAQDPAATDEERQSLSEKAAYLMAKYGVEALLERPKDQPLNVINIELILGAPHAKLRSILIHRVSKAFNCKSVRSGTRVRVFGLKEDIDNFTQMYVSLWIQALFALAASTKPEWVHGKTHNHSYLLGFIDEVCFRVTSATRRASQEAKDSPASTASAPSNAIVLRNRDSAVESAVSLIYPRLRKGTASRPTDYTSYSAGSREGARADINQPGMGGSHPSTARPASSTKALTT